jgi:hypothetical protein
MFLLVCETVIDSSQFMFWANWFPKCGTTLSIAVRINGCVCWHVSSGLPTSRECQRWSPPLTGLLFAQRQIREIFWPHLATLLLYFFVTFWMGTYKNVYLFNVCLSVCFYARGTSGMDKRIFMSFRSSIDEDNNNNNNNNTNKTLYMKTQICFSSQSRCITAKGFDQTFQAY